MKPIRIDKQYREAVRTLIDRTRELRELEQRMAAEHAPIRAEIKALREACAPPDGYALLVETCRELRDAINAYARVRVENLRARREELAAAKEKAGHPQLAAEMRESFAQLRPPDEPGVEYRRGKEAVCVDLDALIAHLRWENETALRTLLEDAVNLRTRRNLPVPRGVELRDKWAVAVVTGEGESDE